MTARVLQKAGQAIFAFVTLAVSPVAILATLTSLYQRLTLVRMIRHTCMVTEKFSVAIGFP